MNLSGLVLDVYDDQGGSVLKSIYPSQEALPGMVKAAHVLTADERSVLPDDVFALVLTDDSGNSLRKFACVDEGNTALNVGYFLHNRHKLPEEAQKVAAANLLQACEWYELQPPEELAKVALGLNTVLGVMSAKSVAADTKQQIHENLGSCQPGIVNTRMFEKKGEVSGTPIAPNQEDLSPAKGKAVVKKTAAAGHLVQGKEKHPKSEKSAPLEENAAVPGVQPAAHQQKQLTPHVNVQGAEPPSETKLKVSMVTALPGRYPLDSYQQVKVAAAYFEENHMHFTPVERHVYCANLAKRASVLGIPISETAQKYGSTGYAPEDEIEYALDLRRSIVADGYRDLLNKLSSVRESIEPDVFCLALGELDKTAGIAHHYDREIFDPYFSTFGSEKMAEYTENIGNDYVNEDMLKQLAQSARAFLAKRFGEDMAGEFQKDPVGIFKSLPMEQKKIIMRLSADSQPAKCGT